MHWSTMPGVGMLNVLEGATIDKARELFEINVLGTMAMTRAVMPGDAPTSSTA